MKRTVCSTSYAIELTTEQFQQILDWDALTCTHKDRRALVDWIEGETTAHSVDYDAQFGPYVFYTVDNTGDLNSPVLRTHKQIEEIIQKILD